MRKLTCPPSTITIGQNLRAFTDNLLGSNTEPIMRKHGMVNLDPNTWYPLHKLLDAINELAETPNHTLNFVAIGMMVGEIIPFPPEYGEPTLENVIHHWDDLYQGLHRNGYVGGIRYEKVGKRHDKTMHSTTYPDDMSYGLLYAYARRFLPPGTQFTVYYDPDIPARDYGGDREETIIHIEWD